jgi:Fe-S cluster assembly iron-binding protein IscA
MGRPCRAWLCLTFVLIVGCDESRGKRSGARQPPARPMPRVIRTHELPWIEVSADPKVLAAARRPAKQSPPDKVERALKHLAEMVYFDETTLAACEARREKLVPRLKVLCKPQAVTQEGVGAATLLLKMHDPAGLDCFCRVLEGDDSELQERVLNSMDESDAPLVLAHADLVRVMLQLLDDPDEELQGAAMGTCRALELPGVYDRFKEMLKNPEVKNRGNLCFWLVNHDASAENLEIVSQELLFGAVAADRHWIESALHKYAQGTDEELAEKAMGILRKWHDAPRDKDEDSIDYILSRTTSLLIRRSTADSVPWLKRLLASSKLAHIKGEAMLALDRLEGDTRHSRLFQGLRTAELKHSAIQAIGEIYKGRPSTAVIQRLRDATTKEDSLYVRIAVAQALLNLGGSEAKSAALALADQLDPYSRMDVIWKGRDWTLLGVMPDVVDTGLLDEAAYQKALKSRKQSAEEDDTDPTRASWTFVNLLHAAGIAPEFDAEVDALPCPHDELLHKFAACTGGLFQPEAVNQTWNQKNEKDYGANYTLQFIFDGKLYRITLRRQYDSYDVERMVCVVNLALRNAGKAEQFVPLGNEGSWSAFVFGHPDALQKLAEKFYLPLDQSLQQVLRIGKGAAVDTYQQPLIRVTPLAATKLQEIRTSSGFDESRPLRLTLTETVASQYEYRLAFEDDVDVDNDLMCESEGVFVVIAKNSENLLRGTTIGYVDQEGNRGFTYYSPNFPQSE